MELIRTGSEDTSWQSTRKYALFRRKSMIAIAKVTCLTIHTTALESPTRLILVL
jgi:hypothetical protein